MDPCFPKVVLEKIKRLAVKRLPTDVFSKKSRPFQRTAKNTNEATEAERKSRVEPTLNIMMASGSKQKFEGSSAN